MVLAALGTMTGDVPMHATAAQRSESGSFECGQQGCADAVGVNGITAHVMDTVISVDNSKSAESLLIPPAVLFSALDIAVDVAR
jgi:hypothetical protein